MPGISFDKLEDYQTPDSFYGGEESFDTQISADSVWSAGYAYGSLLDGLDILGGNYLMAGALQTFKGQTPTEIAESS